MTLKGEEFFFDDFAKTKQFNHSDASEWYSTVRSDIIRAGGGGVLNYYRGSHIKALVDLYPELGLQKEKFGNLSEKSGDC